MSIKKKYKRYGEVNQTEYCFIKSTEIEWTWLLLPMELKELYIDANELLERTTLEELDILIEQYLYPMLDCDSDDDFSVNLKHTYWEDLDDKISKHQDYQKNWAREKKKQKEGEHNA